MMLSRQPADPQALHYFEPLLLQPGYWGMAKGSSIPVSDSGFRRLWDAPPPTVQTVAGAVDAGAQAGMFSVKVMRKSIWIPATKENSLCYTQKKILLTVTYRKFIVRDSRYLNGSFTELKDSWVHWFPQSQDLTSRSICCDHFSLTFGLIVCGLT